MATTRAELIAPVSTTPTSTPNGDIKNMLEVGSTRYSLWHQQHNQPEKHFGGHAVMQCYAHRSSPTLPFASRASAIGITARSLTRAGYGTKIRLKRPGTSNHARVSEWACHSPLPHGRGMEIVRHRFHTARVSERAVSSAGADNKATANPTQFSASSRLPKHPAAASKQKRGGSCAGIKVNLAHKFENRQIKEYQYQWRAARVAAAAGRPSLVSTNANHRQQLARRDGSPHTQNSVQKIVRAATFDALRS